jgi:starch phosphorylase
MIFKSIFVYPRYPENLQQLYDMACNLWSTWNYDAVALFYRIDTPLFRKVDHNPLRFLHSLSKEKMQELSNDKGFLFELNQVWEKFQHYLQYTGTFKEECQTPCNFEQEDVIAYFSMEFGLHESIRIYAGGLGILAGDFLKGASDLTLPMVGIGILYKFGYFTQHIDINGYQQEVFDKFQNHLIPVRELYDSNGNWAHVNVKILDEDVKVKLWKIDIGKTKLILLDTDIEDNPPNLRNITNELYASDREKRIQQELILGIGGIRALSLLGINAKIYHLNEGHSAFAVIGRLQQLMEGKKFSFSQAKAIIKHSTVFTTHTPVKAGNENFNIELVKKYLQPKLKNLGVDFDQILSPGRLNKIPDIFWLPAFAMNFAKYINGVSTQHADISRKMWSEIFLEKHILEVPINSIANGVHISWISHPFTDLFNRYLGPNYIHCGKRENIWKNIYNIPDDLLWEEHRRNKKDMLNFIRRQFARQMAAGGYLPANMYNVNRMLHIDYLTIVFARRFAAYKRPTLILKDKKRFKKILSNPSKPLQIIFAGKAHPADKQSKEMIKEIIDFAKEYKIEDKVIFLENYDINIARHLLWGADIWLNNPIQDMEASGTSGMKAAMNGVLHLSTLQGWWLDGYNSENGWAITAGDLYKNWDLQNIADANQLYDLLEYEITESYYNRNEADVPETWVKMMKNSLFSVCSNFNINRTLCDYLNKCYIPAKENTARISENNYKLLKLAAKEEEEILKHWENIKIISFSMGTKKNDKFSEGQVVEAACAVKLGQAPADIIGVEFFYMYDEEKAYKILPMELSHVENDVTFYKYALKIEGYGPQSVNVRIKPANEIIRDIHPNLIKWKD